jgi:hypothetical protein
MAEVTGPAERGGVEPVVADAGVGAKTQQGLGQLKVPVLGRLVQRRLAWLRTCSKLGSSGRQMADIATPFACPRSASPGRKEE